MKQLEWVCVPVIIDDTTSELFEMAAPDEDPEQQLTFRVTQSTADLVPQDFNLYKPSLQRMADDWRSVKQRLMQGKKGQIKVQVPLYVTA
jgi:hypothetical protein